MFNAPSPEEEVFTSPPSLCVEVLSPRDTAQYMREKFDDYLSFGVPCVWIINPWIRKGYVITQAGMVEAASGILETHNPDIAVPLTELFVE